jgi:hypothetical protein
MSADNILVGSLEGKRLLARHNVDGRILLKWVWTEFIWCRIGASVD